MTTHHYLVSESWSLRTHCLSASSYEGLLLSLPSHLSIPLEHLHARQLSASTVTLSLRLPGGKGGFGSLLRSMNPKKTLADNYDSCRDLSGRRLRTVQMEQRMQEWQARQAEEERHVQEEVKRYEEQKRDLKKGIRDRQYKVDDTYKRLLTGAAKEMEHAV